MKTLITIALALFCSLTLAQPAYYTGIGDGIADNTPTFNVAQAAVCASSNRDLIVPAGRYRFLSSTDPATCTLNLICEGRGNTWLIKDFNGGGGYFFARYQNTADYYGGGKIQDCTILAGPASTNGIFVWVKATTDVGGLSATTKNPHGFMLDNVGFGADVGGGTVGFCVYLDGYYNQGPGALGIRDVKIRDSSCSAATTADIYLYNARGTHITNTECFGSPSIGPIVVDGASDSNMIISRTCDPTGHIINGSVNTWTPSWVIR